MKYYLDITLLPDAETQLGFLWQKIYQQVHLALVENKIASNQSKIALSWPQYNDPTFPLGATLRLFADTQARLELLDIMTWLKRLACYVDVTAVKEVPKAITTQACFKRVQVTASKERKARRRVKRHGGTLEEAIAYFTDFEEQYSTLPFINLKSLSENKRFKLFINKMDTEAQCDGDFNCYGLSKTATVPLF